MYFFSSLNSCLIIVFASFQTHTSNQTDSIISCCRHFSSIFARYLPVHMCSGKYASPCRLWLCHTPATLFLSHHQQSLSHAQYQKTILCRRGGRRAHPKAGMAYWGKAPIAMPGAPQRFHRKARTNIEHIIRALSESGIF